MGSPPAPAPRPHEGPEDGRANFIDSIRSGDRHTAWRSFLPDSLSSGYLERVLTGLEDSLDELIADTSARISTALEFTAAVRATPAARRAEAERLAMAFAERDARRFWAKHGCDSQ